MNLEAYRLEKERRAAAEKIPRTTCGRCRRPTATCYCARVRPFSPSPLFVILIHHHEARRSIATGRMAHLCLTNSLLLEGTDFTHSEKVNALLADPGNHPVVLYPGLGSIDITDWNDGDRRAFFPEAKRLVVFVLDATWAQAKRVRRLSRNLAVLPTIRFTPKVPSAFHVRKQPSRECYSTVEAIHWLLGKLEGSLPELRGNLLDVFTYMVNLQLGHEQGRRPHLGGVRRRARPTHTRSGDSGGLGRSLEE